MSESDKTRQKLVDSMRKTKTGTAVQVQLNTTDEKPAPEKTQPAAIASKTGKTKKKTVRTKPENPGDIDGYQSRQRRVWPD